LVIAKPDRLSHKPGFVATLMDSGIEFVAVDNPHANKLTFHILAAVAKHERESGAECFGQSYRLDRRRRPAPSKPMRLYIYRSRETMTPGGTEA
jgi:hypothetical protein